MTVTRETFITAHVRQYGTDPVAAERAWNRMIAQQRHAAPTVQLAPEDERALERDTQAEIVKLFRAFGCVVRGTSQARPSKIAVGLPDLLVHHRGTRQFWFWEAKRPRGGVLSADQLVFAEDCAACDTLWGVGSRVDAEAWLIARGIAERRTDGGLDPARRPNAEHEGTT
jgi:hypothetical protein